MGMILCGLALVLDVPARLASEQAMDAQMVEGLLFGFTAAAVFACALWITEHKLSKMPGTVRSMLTLLVVFVGAALAGTSGLLPGGVGLPASNTGWLALACLVLLYGVAFSALFILVTRLNIARNAPVMNIEPVAGMFFGWLILDQLFNSQQVIGGLIVIGGIVLLTYRKAS